MYLTDSDAYLKTVEEITDYTKAGAFCKSCIKPGGHEEKDIYLVDVLKDVRAEMEEAKLKTAADASSNGTLSFDKMTLVQNNIEYYNLNH